MSMSAGGMLSYAGKFLAMVWVTMSGVKYFLWDEEQALADLKGAPMPLNDAGFKYFETNFLRPAYNEKKVPIQVHTAVTAFIMAALIVQLVKKVRQKAMWVHRWLGRLLLIVILAALYSFAMLVHRQPNKIGRYAEYPLIFFIPYYAIKGWLEIRNKQTQAHRSSMIMLSSCFFFFAVQRLVMLPFGFLHSETLGPYLPLGPWKNWQEKEYETMFGHAIVLAGMITFSVAYYKAYGGSAPAKKDGKKA